MRFVLLACALALATPLPEDKWFLPAVYIGLDRNPQLNADWGSQVGQDRTLADIFEGKEHGYFLDIGAGTGVEYSNTLVLERENGWHGLCVDANAAHMRSFYGRGCKFIQAVLGPSDDDEVVFQPSPCMHNPQCSFLGGVVGPNFDNKLETAEGVVRASTVAITSLFRDFDVPSVVDYMSLDIEGAEGWVFGSFPWDEYTFLVMTVERPKEDLVQTLLAHGYSYVMDHGGFGDEMWIHSSLENYEYVMKKYGATKPGRAKPRASKKRKNKRGGKK